MLVEISSDKFISDGEVRPKIEFHEGLNIVVGDGNKSNSIGKSTFLMIIDFCFGGNDYVTRGEDIIKNVGDHTVKFAFKFDNELYYFSRSTENKQVVHKCDNSYDVISELNLKDFNTFLKESYTPKIDLTFRDAISKYFRIYGRNVTEESKPLKISNEPEEKSIKRLLKLYKHSFKELEEIFVQQKNRNDSFKSSVKTGIQEKINKSDFNRNEKEITKLKEEISKVTNNFIGTEEAEVLANLKSDLAKLRRERSKVEGEKTVVIDNSESFFFDPEVVRQFFPSVEVKKLSDIENFHSKIVEILQNEIQYEIEQKESILQNIDEQMQKLEESLEKYSTFGDINKKQLAFIQESQRSLDELERKNQVYTQGLNLKEASDKAKENLNSSMEKMIKEVSKAINSQLKLYSSKVFQDERRIAPEFSFSLNKKKSWTYKFHTKNDTGTGAAFRGLILFDLTILEQTDLPAVAHDSFLFTDIETSTLLELLQLYNSFKKQVFVALTDPPVFPQNIKDTIQSKIVLSLSAKGNELFGKDWKTE